MGFAYQKLPENHQRVARSGFPAKAWAVVRRVVRHYMGRRRRWLATRNGKKVMWGGLWVRVGKAVGRVRARERPGSYDWESYARNFDDGVWKEEEEFWRNGQCISKR